MLGGLAALSGRVSRLDAIHSDNPGTFKIQGSSALEFLPPEVGGDAYRLSNYSIMGGPADSITSIADRCH